jgi:hypothetical protein
MRTLSTVTLIFSALLGLAASAFAGTVYKWVDEKGVVHYSDQPHPDAQTIDVKSAQTYSAPSSTPAQTPTQPQRTEPATTYSVCELYRPENDEVFLNTDTVTAKLRVDPALRPGDRVTIVLDGKRQHDQSPVATEFTLKVERGSHSLTAVVEDPNGKTMCTTTGVTFHVRQPSVKAPNRANRPRF